MMSYLLTFLILDAKLYKMQGTLHFYQLNFFILLFIVITLLYYIYLQKKTITLLQTKKREDKNTDEPQKNSDSVELASTENNFADIGTDVLPAEGLSAQDESLTADDLDLSSDEENFIDDDLNLSFDEENLTRNDFLRFEKEENTLPQVPLPNDEDFSAEDDFSNLREEKPSADFSLPPLNQKTETKGNTYLFSLPVEEESKEVVIGNQEGSVPTHKNFISERHLQLVVACKNSLYQVEFQALGYSVFMLPQKMRNFKQLTEPLTFIMGTSSQAQQNKGMPFFALSEISNRSPLRFRLGDGNSFLEIHFYTYGLLEVREKQNIFKNFYIRVYKSSFEL